MTALLGRSLDMWTTAGLPLLFSVVTMLTYLSVDLVRRGCLRCKLLDMPNERSSHRTPIPIGGGVALVFINLAGWVALATIHPLLSPLRVAGFLAGAALIAGVSFVDDIRHVPFGLRFIAHCCAALVVISVFSYWNAINLPIVGIVALGGFGAVITFFWIVGLVNAYNFMDGIDGMAAGQAAAAGIGWVGLGLLGGHPVLAIAGGILTASSLGFLLQNWHPARIFMGDVGSTFLGYSLAVLAVIGAHKDPKLALAGVLLVWPVIFDSAFTVVRRLRAGQSIFVGHQSFLFHRLVAAGWSHSAAALLYIPLPILGAALAYGWDRGTRPEHESMALVCLSACVALWMLVRHQEGKLAGTDAWTPQFITSTGEQLSPVRIETLNGSAERLPVAWVGPLGSVLINDRRSQDDRRSGIDRRVASGVWTGPERRKSTFDRRAESDRRVLASRPPDDLRRQGHPA